MRATIKQIAKIANVSPKTVSKSLNDKSGVSEELRNSIKKLAQDLGYIPNMLGRGLQGHPMNTIGVLISDNTSPSYSEIIKGIESKAEEHNYNIILCNSNENNKLQDKHIKMLIEKQVDGIIMAPVPVVDDLNMGGIDELSKRNIPFIFINRKIIGKEFDCVQTDNVLGGYLATKYLIEKGHRNIIHLTTSKSISSASERIQGYMKALQEADIPFDTENVFYCETVSIDCSYQTMLGILKGRRNFSAIFAFNDIVAYGIIKAVYECRLRIPSDVAIIGYDDLPYSQICLVPLTTVHQESYQIGATAMEMLLQKIENPRTDLGLTMLQPRIVERSSV